MGRRDRQHSVASRTAVRGHVVEFQRHFCVLGALADRGSSTMLAPVRRRIGLEDVASGVPLASRETIGPQLFREHDIFAAMMEAVAPRHGNADSRFDVFAEPVAVFAVRLLR